MACIGANSNKNHEGDSTVEIPAGWWFVETNNGSYYTNEIGQQFETMADLMRYVNYAKRAKLSIYAPDYKSEASSGGPGGHQQLEENPKEVNGGGPVMGTEAMKNSRRSLRLAKKKNRS